MRGKAVWLHSSGGQEVTFIDGEGTRRGIYCDNEETNKTIIEGFTINNGYTSSYGGGMFISGASPSIRNCIIANNAASVGGAGMFIQSANPQFTDCTINNNSVISNAGKGGGVYFGWSNPQFTNCTFDNNFAAASGGGIHGIQAIIGLHGCTFINNESFLGGGLGLLNCNQPITIDDCIFKNNTADSGGGFHCTQQTVNQGGVNIFRSSFESNTAKSGGGILLTGYHTLSLSEARFCNNSPDHIVGDWVDNCGNVFDECLGACCTNNTCVLSEQDDCFFFGGKWMGEQTACEDNLCASTCYGDIDGDGIVNIVDVLGVMASWGACP
jgi:predicted outer membrane repeat protein